jgi:sulfur-carrier protein
MHVNLYATFRLHAGLKSLDLELPAGTTVRQLMDSVVAHAPGLRRHWFDEQDQIHVHVHGFVNGSDVGTLPDGWETPLQPDDVLDFFPPVAGGSI